MKLIDVVTAETMAKTHENNRRLQSSHKLRNQCLKVIVANKRSFCQLAIQSGRNPMKNLAKEDRNTLIQELSVYKSRSGDDFKSSCHMLAMLVHPKTFKYILPQCDETFNSRDFTHLEFYINDIAMKSRVIQVMRLRESVPLSYWSTDAISRNIFLRRLGLMRNLRVLHADTLVCNSDDLKLIASNFPLLTELDVQLDTTLPIESHRPGLKALSQLRLLANFKIASNSTEITRSEVQLVSLCMFMMHKLKTVGRSLIFSPDNAETLGSLTKSYHNAQALQHHVENQQEPALEEFYAHTSFWTPDTARLLPKLKRLHVIGNNDHIPNTLRHLSLYNNYNLEAVRAFTPRLCSLSLSNCELTGVPSGGLLALCPNLVELHLVDCVLVASNVALSDDVCRRSQLQLVTFRGRQGVPVDGVTSRLLQAPRLQKVQISVASVRMAEVLQLVWQVCHGRILQKVRVMNLKGDNFEQLVRTARAVLPMASNIS